MPSCPISNERVNERVARLVGALVFVTTALYLIHPSFVWLLVLLADFTARSFYRPYSLFAHLAKPLAERMGAPRIVDAAPKIFAARIGLVMTLGALAALFGGSPLLSQIIIGVMLFCAFMEAGFGYCVGCKFYGIYRKLFANK